MKASLTIPLHSFRNAMQRYAEVTKKDLRELVNQRALNVAGRAMAMLPPADISTRRKQVSRYLGQPIAQKIRQKRSGQFVKAGRKTQQLTRAILIAQARARRGGSQGLYGDTMRAAVRKLKGRSIGGVGFLKSVFLPIIVTLNPLCKFKVPFSSTRNISRWPHSAGSGSVTPAFDSMKPVSILHLHFDLRATDQENKVQTILAQALSAAIESERREMEQQIRTKLLARAQQFMREK